MGTPFREVYEAFLGRIEQDEWSIAEDFGDLERDYFELLKMAINRFMFPRISLEFDIKEEKFIEKLSQAEIQHLAIFMKNEWIKRCLSSWKLIQQQYHTTDFEFLSQANHMAKMQDMAELSNLECLNATNLYSRVRDHKPYDWNNLAGGKRNG